MMTKPVSAICALLLLSLLAPVFARTGAAGEPPRPHAGTVPLDLAQVARASGADLRLADPDMTLAGKRVRFLGRLVSIEAVADGRQLATFASGGASWKVLAGTAFPSTTKVTSPGFTAEFLSSFRDS